MTNWQSLEMQFHVCDIISFELNYMRPNLLSHNMQMDLTHRAYVRYHK